MPDLSDCIAMSEDGDWIAFPYYMTRGQVITALAEDSSWWDVIHEYTVTGGHVRETRDPDLGRDGAPSEGGWYEQCDATSLHATPAWIARR